MRVLFPFIGNSVGGSHVSAVDLILRLAEAKIEPKVLLHRAGPWSIIFALGGFHSTSCATCRMCADRAASNYFAQPWPAPRP